MDNIETRLLIPQNLQPVPMFWYVDVTFFIWTQNKREFVSQMNTVNNFKSDLKFTCAYSKQDIYFL